MVLFPFWMFWLRKVKLNLLLWITGSRTFIGQYLQLNFFCPSKRKINSINTLVHCALMICSNSKLQSELDNIFSIMLQNGYPNVVVNSAITQKLQSFKSPVKFSPSKCLVYLHFPWLGTVSMRFKKQIMSSVCHCYLSVEPHVVFTTGQLLPATKKGVLPAFQQSTIIYQYLCHCNSWYVEHQNWPVFSKSISPFLFLQIFQLFSFL